MKTHFLFFSDAFLPTSGELDCEHDDYINPGIYALEAADFFAEELSNRGYPTKFRTQEDWGHWLELEHAGHFTLAVCFSNTGEEIKGKAEHRVFTHPDKPFVRKLFKKIEVREDLEKLALTLTQIMNESEVIEDVRFEPNPQSSILGSTQT